MPAPNGRPQLYEEELHPWITYVVVMSMGLALLSLAGYLIAPTPTYSLMEHTLPRILPLYEIAPLFLGLAFGRWSGGSRPNQASQKARAWFNAQAPLWFNGLIAIWLAMFSLCICVGMGAALSIIANLRLKEATLGHGVTGCLIISVTLSIVLRLSWWPLMQQHRRYSQES